MTTARSILSSLPGIAFATLAVSGETIAICRGEPSHYRVVTTKTAEELNTMYGVSPAQAQAMLAGRRSVGTRCWPIRNSTTPPETRYSGRKKWFPLSEQPCPVR